MPPRTAPDTGSSILAAFVQRMTDGFDETAQQQVLSPRLGSLPTVKQARAVEVRRGVAAADWLLTLYVPGWLRAAGLSDLADEFAKSGPFTTLQSIIAVEADVAARYQTILEWATDHFGDREPPEAVWDMRDGASAAWMAIYQLSTDESRPEDGPWKDATVYQAAVVVDCAWRCAWLAALVVRDLDPAACETVIGQQQQSVGLLLDDLIRAR